MLKLKVDSKETKTELVQARCTIAQLYDIRRKAMSYCDGSISEYILYAALHYTPSKDELVNVIDVAGSKPQKRGPNKKNRPKR